MRLDHLLSREWSRPHPARGAGRAPPARGLPFTLRGLGSPGACSSVGQSAVLIRLRPLVRLQARPLGAVAEGESARLARGRSGVRVSPAPSASARAAWPPPWGTATGRAWAPGNLNNRTVAERECRVGGARRGRPARGATMGARGMPRRQEPRKDVADCEKPRGAVSGRRAGDVRMRQRAGGHAPAPRAESIGAWGGTGGTETS